MRLVLSLELDNAAFVDNPSEIEGVLAVAASRAQKAFNEDPEGLNGVDSTPHIIRDVNGNKVGNFYFE